MGDAAREACPCGAPQAGAERTCTVGRRLGHGVLGQSPGLRDWVPAEVNVTLSSLWPGLVFPGRDPWDIL